MELRPNKFNKFLRVWVQYTLQYVKSVGYFELQHLFFSGIGGKRPIHKFWLYADIWFVFVTYIVNITLWGNYHFMIVKMIHPLNKNKYLKDTTKYGREGGKGDLFSLRWLQLQQEEGIHICHNERRRFIYRTGTVWSIFHLF